MIDIRGAVDIGEQRKTNIVDSTNGKKSFQNHCRYFGLKKLLLFFNQLEVKDNIMSEENKLTKKNFWEDYWGKKRHSNSSKKTFLVLEILKIFNNYLPKDPTKTIIEIGGAPGEYLISLHSQFGYSCNSLDYSKIGNDETKSNFIRAGKEVEVYERDLFAINDDLPKFDIVYSLGFIEHFDNPNIAVKKHCDLLKPGGILILGVPNLTGIYHAFLKHLSPDHDKSHNLKVMKIETWKDFESQNYLKPIFKGYIGGFEPLIMKKIDNPTIFNKFLNFIVKILVLLFSLNFRFLRKFNSPLWSGYIIGVYEKSQ